MQDVPWNLGKVSRHPIDTGYGADTNRVVVGPTVTHYADGTNARQHRKVLPDFFIQTSLLDLFTQDRVTFPHDFQLFRRDLTQDPNPQTRTWEWLTPNQIMRNTKLFAQFTSLILKQAAQWLDQLKAKLLWQATDIMMRLDGLRRVGPGFDNVGVERTLCQVFGILHLLGFFVKDFHEFLANDLPLLFWIRNTLQLAQEAISGINLDDLDAQVAAQGVHYLISLVLAQQAVINKDAGQLVANCLVDQNSRNAGVNPAGKAQDNLFVADFFTDAFNLHVDKVVH